MCRTAALLVVLAACARPPAQAPSTVPSPARPTPRQASIEPVDVEANLYAFAADSFLGRETGTPGAARAARFLAARLAEMGVEPAGDSGYFQRVPLQRQALGPATSFTIVTSRGTTSLPPDELVPLPSLGEGIPLPRRAAEGDLVFAGYAIQDTGLRRDDLANLDLTDKTVVFLDGAPRAAEGARRAELDDPRQLGERLGRVLQRRPAAVIVLLSSSRAGELPQIRAQLQRGALALAGTAASDSLRLPMVLLGIPREGSPLLPARWPADSRAQPLSGRRFRAAVELEQPVAAHNIVAVIRGSDAALAATYVALGAHYDHIGIQPALGGDSIANGADDDGSGSVALLAIARAVTKMARKPARSMLFVWHVGEEQGLFGSEHFMSAPPVPRDSIVAQLNADMIGRNAPDSLYLVGPRAAPNGQGTVLGSVVDSVNGALARPFAINRDWDSPSHPEQIYYRSDHFSYARRGIPIVFFTTGLHDDYHQVSDEPSKIDYDKLARVSTLILHAAIAVAERRTRPR